MSTSLVRPRPGARREDLLRPRSSAAAAQPLGSGAGGARPAPEDRISAPGSPHPSALGGAERPDGPEPTRVPHALLVDDDPGSLEALDELIRRSGFTTSTAGSLEAARQELEHCAPDLAILDLDLPDGGGLELVEPLRHQAEIVVLTGNATIDSAIAAVRSGVSDYLVKPVDVERLERVLRNVKRTLALRRQVSELREDLRTMGRFDLLVGSSRAMQEVYDLIGRVARTSSTVLITGETGTGKEMVAQCIHRLSDRAEEPLVAVNCGAIQPDLIESELFGHESGSFTGANRMRRGLFEQAEGGTMFLDEITEMPLDMQVKLLRVLETRTVRRVGGERAIPVDIRLIAATNRSPETAVREGKLREDLYYRLKVFPIGVPPLRERENDVELLATFFLGLLNRAAQQDPKRFAADALDALAAHDWPGNVRELRNVVERAFILAADRIGAEHVQVDPLSGLRPRRSGGLAVHVGCTVAEAERTLILATLEQLKGDKRKAAETLAISLKTLYSRLNAYGLGKSARARKAGPGDATSQA